jgi:hypothetical protein
MTIKSVQAYVRGNYHQLRDVPRTGWFTHPVAGIPSEGLSKAKRANFLEAVTTLQTEDHSPSPHTEQITLWKVTEDGRSVLEQYDGEDMAMSMPCGHYGFVNERGSSLLACKQCGGRFTKQEVREHEP